MLLNVTFNISRRIVVVLFISPIKSFGDESVIEKIKKLLIELSEHPKTGTGKPERLKGNLAGCWSRRISGKHRMVYEIDDGTVTVVVLYLRGHYGDS